MNKFLPITFIYLIVLTFPPVIGFFPQLGSVIPSVLYFGIIVVSFSNTLRTKSLLLWTVFFVYMLFLNYINNDDIYIFSWITNYLEYALPIIIATYIISNDDIEDCRKVSVFSIALMILIMLLSIRILISDPSALRYTVASEIRGNGAEVTANKKMGLISYSMTAILMVMPTVFLKIFRDEHIKKMQALWIACIVVTFFFLLKSDVATPLLISGVLFCVSLFSGNASMKVVLPVTAVLLLIFVEFSSSIIGIFSPILGDSIGMRFDEIDTFIGSNGVDQGVDLGSRMVKYGQSISCFFSHPLLGSFEDEIGGHSYFLDRFARYGLVGMSFYIGMIYTQFKNCFSFIPEGTKSTYSICLLGMLMFGLLKNMPGMDAWLFMFVYVPCILKWSDSRKNYEKDTDTIIQNA